MRRNEIKEEIKELEVFISENQDNDWASIGVKQCQKKIDKLQDESRDILDDIIGGILDK